MTDRKDKKRKQQNTRLIRQGAAIWLLAGLLAVVPLYMQNMYFDLIEAKARITLIVTIPAVLVGCAACLTELLLQKKGQASQDQRERLSLRPETLLLLAILLWKLAATWFSYDRQGSFYGTIGWHAGSLLEGALILSTLLIAGAVRFPDLTGAMKQTGALRQTGATEPTGTLADRITGIVLWAVAAVNAFILLMAAIQSAGVDLFKLLDRIDRMYFYTYLATIGQKNSFAGYLCLTGPLFWGLYAVRRDRRGRIAVGILSFLSLLGVILCESDSVYAGIGIALLFMLPFYFRTGERMQRAAHLLLMYGICLLLVGGCPLYAQKVSRMRDISAAMLTPSCVTAVLTAGILLLMAGRRATGQQEQQPRWVLYLLRTLELLLIAAIVAAVVYVAAHFDDDWGTRRGLYWRMAWEYYLKLPAGRKITGMGQELLALVYVGLRAERGINVLAVHCEPLQILLTEGIVGAGLYLAFWGAMIGLYLRHKMRESDGGIFLFPLAAYLGQSLFCSVYPVTAAVFSAMAGLYLAQVRIETAGRNKALLPADELIADPAPGSTRAPRRR